MDTPFKDKLPIGRAAFAKELCADWISEHSKVILLSFVTLIALSFCLFQLMGKFNLGKKSDYLEVENAFSVWSSDQGNDPKVLSSLEIPIACHPELEAKFGNHIAQRLLGLGDVKKADKYAKSSLNRAHDLISSYYERFSRNTLAISHGNYASALDEAKRLKLDLQSDDAFWESRDKLVRSGAILYAYNLVRIAALERELHSKQGELKAWDELVCSAGWEDTPPISKMYDPEAYALLAKNFTQGDVTLRGYIEQRRKELMQ